MSEDVESNGAPTEESPLVAADDGEAYPPESLGGMSDEDELDKPWPATFERSISLLAGPNFDATMIDKVTKSPKILTPHLAARARKQFKEDGGDWTPEMGKKFEKGIKKIHSLDFHKQQQQQQPNLSDSLLSEQEKRVNEAKAYRQKLLAKQQSLHLPQPDDGTNVFHSPGYRREKETDHHRKKMQQDPHSTSSTDKATLQQCVFNMANVLMGVGMLGLPFVFKSAGWVGGFFVTLGFATVTWWTSILIGRELNGDPRPGHVFDDNPFKTPTIPGSTPNARMRRPIRSFPDIARESFGNTGTIILSIVLYFELFSCLCIFLVTLGDHLHTLFPSISMPKHVSIVAILLTIPTALLRTPRLLSYLSMVGTFATISVVLAVMCSALYEGDMSQQVAEQRASSPALMVKPPYHVLWRTSGLPIALGLIAYTFSGHAIVPSIYSSMQRPQDYEKMIHATFLCVITCCLIVAVSGYYMFGSMVDDQITISLEKATTSADLAMRLLTWLMVLTAFSKFTLTMFPLALGMEEIIAPYIPSDQIMEVSSAIIKLVLIVLAVLVAIFIPSFSFLCSLVGLICTMIVSAIFPAAAHLKLFGPRLGLWDKIVDWTFVIIGTIMAVVGTIATV